MLVDEYQDTNLSQYQLVKTLVAKRAGAGLTAVGDDDQSIYAWRGAQPENFVQLQHDLSDLKLVKLEQNYRSMGRILALANHLIQHNPRPFDKSLWSELGQGEPILIVPAENEEREAEKTVSALMQHRFQNQWPYKNYAILYRGNHQSRVLEKKLREMHIPYYLSGGQSFFDRSEIKDLMSYLRLIVNPADDTAFIRAIGVPRRGVGASTLEALAKASRKFECGLFQAIDNPMLDDFISPSRQGALRQFSYWVSGIQQLFLEKSPPAIVQQILQDIDYQRWLTKQSASPEQAQARWGNVEELQSWIQSMSKKSDDCTLEDIVASVSLMDLLDDDEPDRDQVSLMTLHASKGLEFPYVSIVGLEEEILPHRSSIEEDMVEEERRLLYVGLTRAQQTLTLSYARQRQRYGEKLDCSPSRFLEELDEQHIVWEDKLNQDPEHKKEVGNAHLATIRALLN